ncbi:MAG: hypothetical protein L0271_14815, partial [Gemmatimonadetes bacterium]|nr:hypothetical protein [Gemmatimonadota bacterium]
MSPSAAPFRDLIESARRRVRRDTRVAAGAAAALVVPAALSVAWLLGGRADWAAPSPWPLVLEAAGLVLVVLVTLLALRRWLRGTREEDVAATAEHGLGLAAGSVMGALELGRRVPAGTSAALARHAEAGIADQFRGRTAREVSGEIGRRASRRRALVLTLLAAFSAVAAVLALAAPSRTQTAWVPLLQPIAHLSSANLPALEVRPGDTEVLRGADLNVTIGAVGRITVALVWRAEGDVLRRSTVSVADGVAEVSIERIDALTQYWVEAPDGARSETFRVVPRDPLLVSELTVEIRYPGYLGRTPERFETDVPPLEIPEGTTIVVGGRATRPLTEALLAGSTGELRLTVDGERFALTFVPAQSGLWEWSLRDASGSTLSTAPPPLDITVVSDEPPAVEITYPAQDTVLDPERVHLIAGDGRDDHGIADAVLVTWRITAGGRSEPRVELPVPIADEGERTLLRTILDLRDRELLPGDTIRYFMR